MFDLAVKSFKSYEFERKIMVPAVYIVTLKFYVDRSSSIDEEMISYYIKLSISKLNKSSFSL